MQKIQFVCLIQSGAEKTLVPSQALDFALAATAFGHEAKLIFTGFAIAHLIKAADSQPKWSRYLTQLDLYDLAPIWVCADSPLQASPDSVIASPDITLDDRAVFPKQWSIIWVTNQQVSTHLEPPSRVRIF